VQPLSPAVVFGSLLAAIMPVSRFFATHTAVNLIVQPVYGTVEQRRRRAAKRVVQNQKVDQRTGPGGPRLDQPGGPLGPQSGPGMDHPSGPRGPRQMDHPDQSRKPGPKPTPPRCGHSPVKARASGLLRTSSGSPRQRWLGFWQSRRNTPESLPRSARRRGRRPRNG
jgi:hypothetical protein